MSTVATPKPTYGDWARTARLALHDRVCGDGERCVVREAHSKASVYQVQAEAIAKALWRKHQQIERYSKARLLDTLREARRRVKYAEPTAEGKPTFQGGVNRCRRVIEKFIREVENGR